MTTNLLTDAELDSAKKYRSMEEAMKEPEKVYVLRLRLGSEFPKNIDQLINLQSLNISRLLLKTLPDNICNLKYLQKLNLSYNLLSELPVNFDKLQNLKSLNRVLYLFHIK